ncbi:MAG: hypothetical protein KAJ11_00540 [Alphaproteobacteria bacterium]|nr:hypothetical protein [Alphaproteobacteria bacterium]
MPIDLNLRRFVLALCLTLAVPLSAAQAAGGEFRYSGGELNCISGVESAGQEPPYLDCLQIGPVRIGETLRTVSMKFGKARQTVNRGPVTERIYPISLNVPAGQRVPYWVIGFEGQRVISIQITGDLRVDQYAFSSIRIGDPESKLLKLFGPAGFSQPAPQIGGVMWGYSPYPVTFELKNGRVYSMRVSEAVGK